MLLHLQNYDTNIEQIGKIVRSMAPAFPHALTNASEGELNMDNKSLWSVAMDG